VTEESHGNEECPTTVAMTAKEERARDAALAMREYEANKLALRTNTARLRALRLAKEAETRQHTKTKEAVTEDR
jgi:hypothetical protein